MGITESWRNYYICWAEKINKLIIYLLLIGRNKGRGNILSDLLDIVVVDYLQKV
jgi:hypothetical protein